VQPVEKDGTNNLSPEFVEIPETSLLFDQLGLILQESKFMALDTNNRLISVFLKLKKPVSQYSIKNCDTNQTNAMAINHTINNYERLFEEALKIAQYSPNSQLNDTQRRSKRSILGLFNLGFNFVTSVISGVNQYRLSKHFNGLQKDFANFANMQNTINKNNVHIQKQFIKLMRSLQYGLKTYAHDLNCETSKHLQNTIQHIQSMEFSAHLEKLLEPLEHGTLTGKLTPKILPYEDLAKILSDHPELNNTLYKRLSPAFFYKSTQLMIVDLVHTNRFLTIHYVLTIPYLTESNTFRRYNVRQTGISLKSPLKLANNNNCVQAKLPSIVVRSSDRYYSLENTICTESNSNVLLCYSQPVYHLPEIECLRNYSTCSFEPIPCSMKYIFDKTGLLIRHENNEPILALERASKPSIVKIKPDDRSISFIPWRYYSLVKVASATLYSPTFISTFVDQAATDLSFNTSSISYNETVFANVDSLIDTNDQLRYQLKSSKQSLWLIYSMIGFILVVFLIFITLKFKNSLPCRFNGSISEDNVDTPQTQSEQLIRVEVPTPNINILSS
jgi:hypothetical protein